MSASCFAVNKDVRNLAVVREVDHARQRELVRWVGVTVLVVAAALMAAWQYFHFLQHGYRLEELRRQRAVEEETLRHLRLEIETLQSPLVVEEAAIRKLGMQQPSPERVVILERVVPSEPPPSTVVAAKRER